FTFFILSFIQSNTSFLIVSLISLIVTLFQMYNVRTSRKRITDLMTRMNEINDDTENSPHIQSTLQEQEAHANELSSIDQMAKQLEIEQLQLNEKKHHFALKDHKWMVAVESEREKYPLLQKTELEYWLELLQHVEK